MCVSGDKNGGQPSVKDGRTHLRLVKEGCQEGYQQGVAAEAARTRGSQVRGSVGEKPDEPSGKAKPRHAPAEKARSAANKQHRGSVAESIIYFRT